MTLTQAAPFRSRVDFSYTFATPHRLTVAMPNSRDKTLLDCQTGSLRMAWTYDDLTSFPLFAFVTPITRWELSIQPAIDGQPFARSTWERLEGYLPVLDNTYYDGRGWLKLDVAAARDAAVTHITIANTGDTTHQFRLNVEKPGNWAGMNPAWVDPQQPANVLLAGWLDRADRVLVFGTGTDSCQAPSATAMCMTWDIPAGQQRSAWLVRPYRAFTEDLSELQARNWSAEFDNALAIWHDLLGRATRFIIPDPGVQNAYYACLSDLFVMREPLADGHIVGTPGTEVYRAPNSYEAGIVAVALDQVGLHTESEHGYEVPLSLQEPDGDWTEPKGWAHLMWGGAGFKSWVVMEHYHLTGNREFLERLYPRMVASTRWQDAMRSKTRAELNNVNRGLMPRGMGDCGLKDGDDLYGVFIPHNIWSVYADKLSVEAARILGRASELPELERIYRMALADLLRTLDAGAIQEGSYRWIPAVANKTSGSRWGVLNAVFPCGLLPVNHELINGTLYHIESHLSPGGIPINTGWMNDGMWVAITLDNVAEAHLVRGEGDATAEYLYAVLNHGTPLYTWCEERGQEPNTAKTSGDRQHLWTPVAVVRALRDSLVMEREGDLELGAGIPRDWLASGLPVGVDDAPTHFGIVSYDMQYDVLRHRVTGHVVFPSRERASAVHLHIRLPGNQRIKPQSAPGHAQIDASGACIMWEHPQGEVKFEVEMGEAI